MKLFLITVILWHLFFENLLSSDRLTEKYPSAPHQTQLQQSVICSDSIERQTIVQAIVVVRIDDEENADTEENVHNNRHSYLRDIYRLAVSSCNASAQQCSNELDFVRESCVCLPSRLHNCCAINSMPYCGSSRLNICSEINCELHGWRSCFISNTYMCPNTCCYISKHYAFPGQMLCDDSHDDADTYCYIEDSGNYAKSIAVLPCSLPCVIVGICFSCACK